MQVRMKIESQQKVNKGKINIEAESEHLAALQPEFRFQLDLGSNPSSATC